MLYGEEWRWDRCGALSEKCQQFFVDEACLYECDVHAGKWRAQEDCSAEDAGDSAPWAISAMPIRASYFDAWYEACKDDLFCGVDYFDMPTCEPADCMPMGEIYANGKDLCDKMWSGSFEYVTDEKAGYTMHFEIGEDNPNDLVHPTKPFPPACLHDTSKHSSVSFQDLSECLYAETEAIMKLTKDEDEDSDVLGAIGVALGAIGCLLGLTALIITLTRAKPTTTSGKAEMSNLTTL